MTTQAATDFSGFMRAEKDGRLSLRLAVEGMNCPGCAFKIEKKLKEHENVDARVNVTQRRLHLAWAGDAAAGNNLVQSAAALGFRFSPVQETPDDGRKARMLLRAMAVAGFAAGNLMIFSFALWFSSRRDMGGATRDLLYWFSALISLPTVIYSGMPFFRSAWRALKARRTNMDVPISVAVILATGMSLFETLRGGDHVYFDSAVMLLFLLLAGRYLDARARAHTRDAAADLLSMMGGTATVENDSGLRRLPASELRPGMVLLVAKGEKVLADGTLSAAMLADTSPLTGETLPQEIAAGAHVFAGTVNLGDTVRVSVEKSPEDSLMGDIVALMQKAGQGNARYVRLADRIASWYTPVVHGLALATFAAWLWAGTPWQQSLLHAITVLIITCPCALGLAVPVAQFVAGSRLFRHGMLVKSGDALERLAMVDTVIFDKTGTLTSGDIVFDNPGDFSAQEAALLAGIAAGSRHPLARAVAQALPAAPAIDVREIGGKGMEAHYNGALIRLGSAAFIGLPAGDDDRMELWFAQGNTPPKRLVFSDHLYDDVRQTVDSLSKSCHVILLSGDRPSVARRIADRAGIDDCRAGINPKQKHDIVDAEIARGRRVLMVGDGLNDAAAIARASVSMSPSTALDIAQNAANIVYQRRGVASVTEALRIARRTQSVVRQNFALALCYNIVAIPLAMAGYVTPLVAAVAMSASSLLVVFNALRLKGDSLWIS